MNRAVKCRMASGECRITNAEHRVASSECPVPSKSFIAIALPLSSSRLSRHGVLVTLFSSRFFSSLAAVFSFAALTAHAEVSCPDTLNVEQRATPPQNWQVANADRTARLIGVTIYDGLPADRKVYPLSRKQSGGTLTVRWRLRENLRSYYLECAYEQTTVRLHTALPPGVLYCEAAFDLRVAAVGGHPVKRMYCQ
jgi:hypothetical protein